MKILLSPIIGALGIKEYGGVLPERMRFLHPEAAKSFREFSNRVIVSDVYRSADASLAAVRAKRGALPPGRSAHGYGLAIDLGVDETLAHTGAAGTGLSKKIELDESMEAHGWYCHRRDHKRGPEDWHYNYLGKGAAIAPKVQTTSGYIEAKIMELYGQSFILGPEDIQVALQKLHLYSGAIDGKLGPLSKEAIMAFQKCWSLAGTSGFDDKTLRVLAFCAAEKVIVP